MSYIIHPIKYGLPEWYEFRKDYTGGSEIGTITRINDYGSIIKLFHQKVGLIEIENITNESMRHGQLLEKYIANEWWMYYDGTIEGTMRNQDEQLVVRNYDKIEGFITNEKAPYMMASVDGLMRPPVFNLITGEQINGIGILECKTISGYVADRWKLKIPLYHITQVQQYMFITECEYSEIALLEDGRKFRVEVIRLDMDIIEKIVSINTTFWENHILPAKKVYQEYLSCKAKGDLSGMEKCETEIIRLEPDPDSTDETKDFLTDRFKKEKIRCKGKQVDHQKAIKYDSCNKMIAIITKEKDRLRNELIKSIVELRSEYMDFDQGYVRLFTKSNSTKPQLAVEVRNELDKEKNNILEGML